MWVEFYSIILKSVITDFKYYTLILCNFTHPGEHFRLLRMFEFSEMLHISRLLKLNFNAPIPWKITFLPLQYVCTYLYVKFSIVLTYSARKGLIKF